VTLVHHHDGRLVPAHGRLTAKLLPARGIALEDATAQEHRERLVQVAAAVESRIEDDAFLLGVATEDVLEDLAIRAVAHAANVRVAEPAARELHDLVVIRARPAQVQELRLLAP